jgi:hypothetical protein
MNQVESITDWLENVYSCILCIDTDVAVKMPSNDSGRFSGLRSGLLLVKVNNR